MSLSYYSFIKTFRHFTHICYSYFWIQRFMLLNYFLIVVLYNMYDEQGKPVVYIDEELRRRLETKLIAKIPTFKVA